MMAINDCRITQPYELTQADKDAIAKAKSDPPRKEDWAKPCLKEFKARFKRHTKCQQKYRCAFCQRLFDGSMFYPHLEHIVPKDIHPKWTLEHKNLCVSCQSYNNNKLVEETLVDSSLEDYPSSSEDFLILNPYHDNYYEHIEIIEHLIYMSKSRKGQFTIGTCQLNKLTRLEERAIFNCLDEKITFAALLQLINDRRYEHLFNDDLKQNIIDTIEQVQGKQW